MRLVNLGIFNKPKRDPYIFSFDFYLSKEGKEVAKEIMKQRGLKKDKTPQGYSGFPQVTLRR